MRDPIAVHMDRTRWESVHALLLTAAVNLDSEGDSDGARQVVGFASLIGMALGPEAQEREEEVREVLEIEPEADRLAG